MGRQTRKKIAFGFMSLILLLSAGCSGKNEENKENEVQDQTQDAVRTEDSSEQIKQLRQAVKPQFIPNGIRSVSLKKDGEEILLISREPAEYKMDFDYWEVLNPYDENVTMDTEAMFAMFEALCSLSFETPAKVPEGTDTGIRESDMSVTVEYVDTMDDSVAQNTDEADTTAEIVLGKEDGNGGRYAAVAGDEEQIYVLPEEILQTVYGRDPFDYILKIPVLISADTLKDIEITAGGKKYEIQVDAAKESYKFGKKKVEKEEFADLYQAISGVMLDSEIEEDERDQKGEPELTVTFHRNMEEAPDVRVSYHSYNDGSDSVEINGEERFLVGKEDVEALIEQIKKAF